MMNFVTLSFVAVIVVQFVDRSDEKVHPSPTKLAAELGRLSTEGLGTAEMQTYFDSLTFNRVQLQGEDIIQNLATRIANKFKEKVEIVRKLKTAVEASYASAQSVTSRQQCCDVDTSKLTHESKFRQKVNLKDVCVIASKTTPLVAKHLQDNVLRTMIENNERYPTLQWQYFGSEEGVYTNYPSLRYKDCSSYDPRIRPWYVETASPTPKDIVLVIDYSGSMLSNNRLFVAKEAAKSVLETLNPRDRVAVILFSDEIRTWNKWKDNCFVSKLADASPVNIKILKTFVDDVKGGGGTLYIKAFNAAFNMLDSTYLGKNSSREPVILFMTDGEPSESQSAILDAVRIRNTALTTRASILTFGMGGGISSKGTSILNALATQTTDEGAIGKYSAVPNINDLRAKMATYYDSLSSKAKENEPTISIPYVDILGLGLLTSITFPCYHAGDFIGVVGSDIVMSDLMADVTYFSQGQGSYAFVSDGSGRTMMHPLLPRPSDPHQAPFYVHIANLELAQNFTKFVFEGIKSGTPGKVRMRSPRFIPRGGNLYEGIIRKELLSTCFWRPVPGTNFTVGVVLQDDGHFYTTNTLPTPSGFKFLYHRLDLNKPTSPCKYFGRYAVKDKSVVKFGPQAFKEPFSYLSTNETDDTVTAYANYFDGKTNINKYFQDTIIYSVYASYKTENIWLKSKTSLSQYVVWRYISIRDGVFRMIPGASLPENFDATGRPWYLAAISNIGKTVLSTPYVDAAGAGLIITAAHTIFKGRGDHVHETTADDVMAVMGADIPLTYFTKLLTDKYEECKKPQYSCFVMDQGGFLVYHDSFMSPSIQAKDLQLVHVTEKEKLVSKDMIDKKILLRRSCRDTASIKAVNYFDVRVSGAVDQTVSVLGCTQNYNIHSIGGTNAYLGVVEKSGSCTASSTCFCSPDKKDKPCLDVIHGIKCECPCSSDLSFNYCENEFPPSNGSICAVPVQALSSVQDEEPCVVEDLQLCYDPRCDAKTSENTCEGVVGCSWCTRDEDDLRLSKPYCSKINECFGGKKGTKAPGSSKNNACKPKGSSSSNTAAIVAGVVVPVVLIVLVVAVCLIYRHNKKPSPSQRSPAPVQTAQPRHSEPHAHFKPGGAPPAMHHGAMPPSAPPSYNPHFEPPPAYPGPPPSAYPGPQQINPGYN